MHWNIFAANPALKSNPQRKPQCPPKRWYTFYYEAGRRRGGPAKEYWGPFDTKQQANAQIKEMTGRYGKIRGERYTVRQLSKEQFECVWGAPPQ